MRYRNIVSVCCPGIQCKMNRCKHVSRYSFSWCWGGRLLFWFQFRSCWLLIKCHNSSILYYYSEKIQSRRLTGHLPFFIFHKQRTYRGSYLTTPEFLKRTSPNEWFVYKYYFIYVLHCWFYFVNIYISLASSPLWDCEKWNKVIIIIGIL